jgi:hypothetical protein
MLKARGGHENVFIAGVTSTNNIPENYHFDFNHEWIANSTETK